MVAPVDYDRFRSIPGEEGAGKAGLDMRGIWPDREQQAPVPLRLAG